MAEIVDLAGKIILNLNEPDAELVRQLTALLELAKSGQVDGFAGVAHWRDESTSFSRVGAQSLSMIGELHVMTHIMTQNRLEG